MFSDHISRRSESWQIKKKITNKVVVVSLDVKANKVDKVVARAGNKVVKGAAEKAVAINNFLFMLQGGLTSITNVRLFY
jgi:hypothetical protein